MNEVKDKDKPFQDIEFKSLKLVFKSILIILFIVFSLLLVFSIKSVAISDDIDYTFEQNIIFNENNPIPIENTTNFRYKQNFTGHYNATYSFKNELGNEGYEIDFVSFISECIGNCLISISSILNGHTEILNISDNDLNSYVDFRNTFSIQTNAIIEYWFLITNITTTGGQVIRFYEDTNIIIDVSLNGNDLYTSNPTPTYLMEDSVLPYTWYHMKFVLDDTTNTFDWYLNGNLEKDDLDYKTPSTNGINIFQFGTGTDDIIDVYFDAIGYSWDDDYIINQNLIPYTISLNESQISDWLFTYDDDGTLYPDGYDNPDSWNDIEAGADKVNIDLIGFNGFYVIDQMSYGSDIGFHKDDFNIIDGIIEVVFTINVALIDTNGNLITNIYSYDSTEIIRIKMYPNGADYKLDYFDGASYVNLYIFDNESSFNYADFHFFIINDITIIKMSISEYDIIEMFSFPIIVNGKRGLSKVKVFSDVYDASRFQRIRYEKIGVYINGSSIVSDYAWTIYQDYGALINSDLNYIYFKINAIGTFSIGIMDDSLNYIQLINTSTYSGYIESMKYNISDNLIWINPTRIKIIYNSSYNLEYIYIESYYLKESTNHYFLLFDYNNIDINNNYFYVENNRLYFNIDLNESSYEGMSASFDINNEFSTNASITFKAKYSGNIAPCIYLNYKYNPISYYSLSYYHKSFNYLLPQNQEITHISINVSDYIPLMDNYTNHESGFISGYISDIGFNFIPNIEYTITVMTLIYGFIPLIVMLVPTFALYSKFGKQIIIPSLIFMSIICLVSQLIPVWLFSMLVIIFGYLILVSRNSGVD